MHPVRSFLVARGYECFETAYSFGRSTGNPREYSPSFGEGGPCAGASLIPFQVVSNGALDASEVVPPKRLDCCDGSCCYGPNWRYQFPNSDREFRIRIN